jgi:hypothetical protein
MSQEMDKKEQEQQSREQAQKPTDALSLAGQGLGLDREEVFDLVLSLKTDANELTKFAENNQDLPPAERVQALKELTVIAGSVEATNVLLEEAGSGLRGRNALYLIGAAKKNGSTRVEPIEGKTTALDNEFQATRRSLNKLEAALLSLSNSLSRLSAPSAEQVEVAVREVATLVPLKIAQHLNQEVQRAVASAKADNTTVRAEAIAQLKETCSLAINSEVGLLTAALEENRNRESRAFARRGAVEMKVWAEFTEHFQIDDRDLAESKWGLLSKMRKAFGGDTLTQCCRRALQIGRDFDCDNIHDAMSRAERGFAPEDELVSIDHEDYEHGNDYGEDRNEWNGSEGWT